MTTDWVLIRRTAFELDERLRGARVLDAGLLSDGRIALSLRARTGTIALAADLFGSPPLVTLEDADLPIGAEPGFIRKLATTLRGMRVTAVRARRGDRVLRLEFGTRSRFGVGDAVELVLELVPRFGNALLVKRGVVVAAAKEFSLAENPARAIAAGQPYVPPPLPASISPPRSLAEAGVTPEAVSRAIESEAALREPLYVYRRGGRIVEAHVVPLPQCAGAEGTREASLLAVFAELRAQQAGEREHRGAQRRRQAIVRRLDARERKLHAEIAALAAKRREAESRGDLRDEGENIFASLHELDDAERADAKDRAAKLFARYKKLQAALAHVETREAALARTLEAVDVLRWETERAGEEDLDDVERAASELEPRRSRARERESVKRRKRKPLEFRTAAGSRIVVGRSPAENADVTFRQARPDDLWFHAQGIPGAHVVLARDDRSAPPDDDIGFAAALAAFHSKARASRSVPVDYTLRKYVRKQQNAPPGLVWYTHPKTILAEPITEDALRTLSNRGS